MTDGLGDGEAEKARFFAFIKVAFVAQVKRTPCVAFNMWALFRDSRAEITLVSVV